MVSSSMSSRLILMSPAMTMPLSSTRSRTSARFADERSGPATAAFHRHPPPAGASARALAAALGQAVEELVLAPVELLGADQPLVELPRQLGQLPTDRGRAVVLPSAASTTLSMVQSAKRAGASGSSSSSRAVPSASYPSPRRRRSCTAAAGRTGPRPRTGQLLPQPASAASKSARPAAATRNEALTKQPSTGGPRRTCAACGRSGATACSRVARAPLLHGGRHPFAELDLLLVAAAAGGPQRLVALAQARMLTQQVAQDGVLAVEPLDVELHVARRAGPAARRYRRAPDAAPPGRRVVRRHHPEPHGQHGPGRAQRSPGPSWCPRGRAAWRAGPRARR